MAAFDLADEGPQLADYLPSITTIADISDTRGQMALFDRLIAEKDSPSVIDVSYRAFKNFFTVVQEIRFFEEARHRFIEPLILFIVDPEPKSAKAYAMLRHQLSEASLLPVRNQIGASAILRGDARPKANMFPASLDIPLLGFSLKEFIDPQSFSFSEFWRAPPADLPGPQDDELLDWVEHIFFQFRDLELFFGREGTSTHVAAHGSRRPRTTHRQRQRDAWPLGSDSRWNAESAAINQLKKKGRIDGDPLEQSGLAIVALLQRAADLSNDSCEHAEPRADELSRDLRAVEDRI